MDIEFRDQTKKPIRSQLKKYKFMKYVSILIILSLAACVGPDTSFLPQTIKESKENKLLIDTYSASDNLIRINDEDFEIL